MYRLLMIFAQNVVACTQRGKIDICFELVSAVFLLEVYENQYSISLDQ